MSKINIVFLLIISGFILMIIFKIKKNYSDKNNNYVIYCFWTGKNKMSDNRKKALKSLKNNSKVNVKFITRKNLDNYILKTDPLHPAYEYLSETHKSDYLRWYFMHHYGGGYSDIKHNSFSWIPYFNQLYKNKNKWALGYQEVPDGACSKNKEVLDNYYKIFGNGSYIFKPKTSITHEWGIKLHKLLDERLPLLKEHPSSYPRDHYESIIPETNKKSKYPLGWTEMLGCILADILYKHKEKLLLNLPLIDTNNYI
jgi:hypothetical protein